MISFTGLLLALAFPCQDPPPVRVTTLAPERGQASRTLVVPARLMPRREAGIVARATGTLSEVAVEEGDLLKKGDLVARIHAPEVGAALQRAVAGLEQARAEAFAADGLLGVAAAERTAAAVAWERVRTLHEKGAATDAERDEAQARFATARAVEGAATFEFKAATSRVTSAEAGVHEAEVLAGYLEIRCPYEAAVVTARRVHAGAIARANETEVAVLTVVNPLRVRFEISESEALWVMQGTPLSLTLDAIPGRTFNPTVSRTTGVLNAGSQSMWVEADISRQEILLLPGMFGRVRVSISTTPDALLLPSKVIRSDPSGAIFVWVVRDNLAVKIPLVLGMDDGVRSEIREGLSAEDSVIASGFSRLSEGAPVVVAP